MKRRNSRRNRPMFEALESRALLAADTGISHNVTQPLDVDDDGEVGMRDILAMVDEMRRASGGGRRGEGEDPRRFVDVNNDGVFDMPDVLHLLSHLRRGGHHGNHGGPAEPRSIDGSGNNLANPDWGMSNTQLLRVAPNAYEDGASSLSGADRPNPREVSNAVLAQDALVPNSKGFTDLLWQWGQFLDHDIDLTDVADPPEPAPIPVPTGDPYFDPFQTGSQEIGLSRSIHDTATGDSAANPRQQINQITAFIDGSNVYGSDDARAAALRTFSGGRLRTSEGDLLPFNTDGLPNAGGPSDTLFLAGDVRANEQIGLTAMHTLWVREHNRLADEYAAHYPELSDEAIYQKARAVVIAQLQAITYNEFLPALLGDRALGPYRGYDETVRPGIANEFSTAIFRIGHTMLSPTLLRVGDDGQEAPEGHIALRDAFFSPGEIMNHGIDSILRGLASQKAQEIDAQVVDDVRNFLFGPPGSGGFDLASLNIQRGRDHGLPDYNALRDAYGLEPVSSFDQITSDPTLRDRLASVYDDVDSIDPWVGMLAEDHVHGAAVGELASAVMTDQFRRLRDGDRFWYERVFSGHELRLLRQTTLASVIMRNTSIDFMQHSAFHMPHHYAMPILSSTPPGSTGYAEGEADAPIDLSTAGASEAAQPSDHFAPETANATADRARRVAPRAADEQFLAAHEQLFAADDVLGEF